MSKNRITKSLTPVITSRVDAEKRMRELAEATNKQSAILADMNTAILNAKAKFETGLADAGSAIKQATDELEAWASANPEEFGKKKSIEFVSGTLGFRTGTPKLAMASRLWNWAKVLLELRNRKWRRFLRVSIEVDKDAILARCGTVKEPTKFQNTVLPKIGLKLAQDETFFIEPNLTTAEEVKVAA